MYYGKINDHDIANGTGVRVSLFVSGCRHHCPGCFNECAWDFEYGEPFTYFTIGEILNLLKPDYIDGLTILGGEPFEYYNTSEVLRLIDWVRIKYRHKKTIWIYSGFTFEELIKREDALVILHSCDVLVDGRFIEAEKDITLKFRGSRNQRIIDVQKSLETGEVVLWNLS